MNNITNKELIIIAVVGVILASLLLGPMGFFISVPLGFLLGRIWRNNRENKNK